MNKLHFHPSDQDLLLYVDGEIPNRKAEQIRRHLGSCWDCRTRVKHLEATIVDFVDLRKKLLECRATQLDLPSAPASRSVLAARMRESATASRVSVWQGLRAGWFAPIFNARPAGIAVAIAVSLTVLLVIEPLFVAQVSANEVIAQVKNAEDRHADRMVVHKRVRIRRIQKAPASEVAVDYDFWRSANRSRLIAASLKARPAAELQAIYQKYGAEWKSPLSGASFARLRELLGDVRDEVSGGDFITLTSVPTNQAREIQRIALTVRRSDWQVVAQRIEMTDADYEVTQLLGEIVPSASIDPEIFGEPLPAPVLPLIVRRPVEAENPPAAPPATPTDEELEASEVLLREALHGTGADTQEFSTIQRRNRAIDFQLWVQTSARKAEVLQAIEQIPYLSSQIYDADAASVSEPIESQAAPPAAPKLYSTKPPLAEALRESFGGIDPANNYLDEVRSSYLRVLVDASALGRLAQRYPDEQWNRLSADLQNRLNAVAADHISKIKTSIPAYLKMISLALDEMPSNDSPQPGGCISWRAAITDLLANLQGLQTGFLRLFVEERLESPVTLSGVELLRESVQARSHLRQSSGLCPY